MYFDLIIIRVLYGSIYWLNLKLFVFGNRISKRLGRPRRSNSHIKNLSNRTFTKPESSNRNLNILWRPLFTPTSIQPILIVFSMPLQHPLNQYSSSTKITLINFYINNFPTITPSVRLSFIIPFDVHKMKKIQTHIHTHKIKIYS